ncbi:MAG: sigma-70 family RNA polymerase sigma factor [Verrucomicrobia bacterium]|nr:sigma-70 family RNA polymerase sigma factor [Verrucomicrobiota bacterium]
MPPSEQSESTNSGQARWPALSLSKWFAEEVQPHEPALRAYLQARFPSLSDHDDIVQESYVRLLRAQAAGHVRYAKAFLFTTARNAALDLFRRRRVLPMEAVTDFKELFVLEERPGMGELVDQQYELEVLADAVRALPDRCRQVIMLRYLDGLAYKEIAVQLGISPETVKVHMAKGMRRCAAFFAERGLLEAPPAAGCRDVAGLGEAGLGSTTPATANRWPIRTKEGSA